MLVMVGTAAVVWLTTLQDERNGRTGVLLLANNDSGCVDIGREYCEA